MKLFQLLFLSLIFAFAISSCSKKATKEQAIEFFAKMNEYVASPEFGKEFAATFDPKDSTINWGKVEQSINSIVIAKENKLAQEMGLKTFDNIAKDDALMNTPEVKNANEKFKKSVMMHSHLIMMGQSPSNAMSGMDAMHGNGMGMPQAMPPKEPVKTEEPAKK